MMFSAKFIPVAVAALAVPALAAPATNGGGGGGGQCNTGAVQCCNQVQSASSQSMQTLAGLLGIVLGPLSGNVGLGCSPITIIGAAGNNCASQPVCCQNNQFNGLINVGCSPINIGL